MKNKIREKIIASIMLSAFAVTNCFTTAAFAMDDYYGYSEMNKPAIRSAEAQNSVNMDIGTSISNADSVVNLSLRDADIRQVLRMFADQAGMNIIFSPSITEGTVTMDLVDIPLQEALNLVVKTNDLFYDIQANTLLISKKSEAMSVAKKDMTLIPVKYVNAAALASFLNTNIFKNDSVKAGVSVKPVVTINPATNELIVMGTANDAKIARQIVEQFDKKPTVTTFKVNHTTPAEMADLICSSLLPTTLSSEGGSGGGGGGNSSSSAGGGGSSEAPTGFAAGVPTGFATDESSESSEGGGGSNNFAVGGGKLLCTVDSSVSSDGLEGLSLKNLSVSYFPTLGTIQIIGGSESQLEMIRDYIAANDKKTPQAYLEVQIISLSENGSKTFDNTWQYLSKNFSFNANGGIATNSMYPVFFAGKGYTLVNTQDGWDDEKQRYETTGKVGKWSTSPQLVYSMNYIIENDKGRVLANPRLLVTSGQSSTIDLTSDYVSKVTTQYLDNGSSTGSQVQKEYEIKNDNGIKVSITPFISPDGYVTLDIKPQYATIATQVTSPGEVEGERDIVATLLQRRNLDLKGIRIKDGETLVIGGLIQETETKSVKKIPFLGDLPVVGMFFRSTSTAKRKDEMVMMITPQIIIDTEDAVADDTTL